jgi:broad specificity phosphatase PhoE
MNTKTIFCIRHGETEGNTRKMYQRFTTPLSEEGAQQATKVAGRAKNLPHEVIIASHLTRAQQTAEAISAISGRPIVTSELFQERQRPTEIRGKYEDDPEAVAIANHLKEHYYSTDTSKRYSDEEFFFEMHTRAEQALSFLLERSEQHLIVVSHREFLTLLVLTSIFGKTLTPETYKTFWAHVQHANTGITKLVHTAEKGWKLHTWSDEAHLG